MTSCTNCASRTWAQTSPLIEPVRVASAPQAAAGQVSDVTDGLAPLADERPLAAVVEPAPALGPG